MDDGRPRNFPSYTEIAVSSVRGETSLIIQLNVFLRETEVRGEDKIYQIIAGQ